ncbi:hypothetical protein [Pseudomonas sp.]|uniref:hypothetical protein n=1 Tax=Pseudomonas sp. TaxID=306 RepID=UPI003BB7A899
MQLALQQAALQLGRHINDLAKGEVCLALTYNGAACMAAESSLEAKQPFELQ